MLKLYGWDVFGRRAIVEVIRGDRLAALLLKWRSPESRDAYALATLEVWDDTGLILRSRLF